MIPKKYSSFNQINEDLRILSLKQQVDLESLKLSVNKTKKSLYPTSLLGGFGGVIKKLLLSVFAKKVLDRFK